MGRRDHLAIGGSPPEHALVIDPDLHPVDSWDAPPPPLTDRPPLVDDAQLRELALRWVDAFNRRDGAAFIGLTHPGIAFHPTVIARRRRVYRGHAGVRAWLRDVAQTGAPLVVGVREVRMAAGGDLLVFGHVLIDGEPIIPFALLMQLQNMLVIESRAYLSDEALLQYLGHLGP